MVLSSQGPCREAKRVSAGWKSLRDALETPRRACKQGALLMIPPGRTLTTDRACCNGEIGLNAYSEACLSLSAFVVAMATRIVGAIFLQKMWNGPVGKASGLFWTCGMLWVCAQRQASGMFWRIMAAWRTLFLPHQEGALRSHKGSGV